MENDLISRSALLAALVEGGILPAMVRRTIENAPAVDAVPVVRCRDCKHWLKDFAGCSDIVGRCEWANYAVGANGYCLYGERKEGAE